MRIVAYYRVSTAAQGRSGLGLEAQRSAVQAFAVGRAATIIAEFTEVESGKLKDRPELARALHLADVTGATLVIAKLDRLSRNVAFLATLKESGAKFTCADMPEATDLTVHIMAACAQDERERISMRTREALAAAKARGMKLGNPNGAAALRRAGKGNAASIAVRKAKMKGQAAKLASVVRDIQMGGAASLHRIAAELNSRGIQTPQGKSWHATSVRRLLARLEPLVA